MVWVLLLFLMLLVAAAPGISIYLEHVRGGAAEASDGRAEGPQQAA